MNLKEKKEFGMLGVLVLATFVVIYVNFLKPKPATPPPLLGLPGNGGPASSGAINSGAGVPSLTPVASQMPGVPGAVVPGAGLPGAVMLPTTNFLPNGADLQIDVLKNKPFSALVPPQYPSVTKEEVGSDNVFAK
jgi:hypothetical protein